MRKLSAVILSVFVLCGSVLMSGCSDFEFNPIGEWKHISTTYEGAEVEMMFEDISLVFRHNGTAYMSFNGDAYSNYSYTYTDKEVTLTDKANNNGQSVYQVKNNGTTLELTNGSTVTTFERA